MKSALLRVLPLIAAIAGLFLFFSWRIGPGFLSSENLMDLAQQIAVNAILALGITFTILIGGIDLSVGSVLALSGTVTVYLLTVLPGVSGSVFRLGVAVLTGVGVAGFVGLLNGACISRTKMPPFIVTLATMLIARGLALSFNDAKPISVPDAEGLFAAIGNHRVGGLVPVPVLILLGIFAGTTLLLHFTRFGQHLLAIGGSREAARYTGIAIAPLETLVYVLCGSLAGVAGMIQASQLYMASPASAEGYELSAIAASVVGGTSFRGGVATTYGTLLGAVVIGILEKGLNQSEVHFSLKYIVKGCVILAAVYLDVRRRRV